MSVDQIYEAGDLLGGCLPPECNHRLASFIQFPKRLLHQPVLKLGILRDQPFQPSFRHPAEIDIGRSFGGYGAVRREESTEESGANCSPTTCWRPSSRTLVSLTTPRMTFA